jgi:hypothetical protein
MFPLGAIGATHAIPTFADTIASSSLSGTAYPCSSFACRTKHADHGARFAALYSNHTFIRSPFEGLQHKELEDYRTHALAALSVLYTWRPLLISGYASHLADICLACIRESVSEDRILPEPVQKIGAAMEEHLLNKTKAVICRDEREVVIRVGLPP